MTHPIYSVVHLQPKVGRLEFDKVASEFYRRFRSIRVIPNSDDYISFYTNPSKFFTPSEFTEIQYIFVGEYGASIALVLEQVEKAQSLQKLPESTRVELSNHFGYDVTSVWANHFTNAIKNKRTVRFVPYMILPDDSVQLIHNIITACIPQTTFEQIYLFADKGKKWTSTCVTDADIIHAVSISMHHYINKMKSKGRKIPMEMIQPSSSDILEILRCWGIPRDTVLSYPLLDNELKEDKSWNYHDFIGLLHTPTLIEHLRVLYRISSLSHQWSIYHRAIPYMSHPMPLFYATSFNAIDDDDDTDSFIRQYRSESVVDATKEFRLNQKGYLSVLRDVLPYDESDRTGTTTTLYMYSLSDFPGTQSASVEEETSWIRKFFPQWNSLVSPRLSPEEHKELKESLVSYNAISTSMDRMELYTPDSLTGPESGIVQYRDTTHSYIELQYNTYMHSEEYDVLTLFNLYPMSFDYPFITLRDPGTKENVYKIFKDIAHVTSSEIEPYVSRRDMERWFQYTTYVFEHMRMRDVRDIIRGVHCKVFWHVGHLETFERKGTVQSVDKKSKTCVIYANNKYYQDVPLTSHFITRIVSNADSAEQGRATTDSVVRELQHGQTVMFFVPQRKFIDIDMDTRGTVHIRAPVHDIIYQTKTVTELTADVARVSRKWMTMVASLSSPPATSILPTSDDGQDTLQLRQNGQWVLPEPTPVTMTDNLYTIRIDIPRKYPIVYHNFVSVLKQMYSYFVVNESVITTDDVVDYFDSDSERWLSVKVSSYNLETNSYTVEENTPRNPRRFANVRRNYLRYPKDAKQRSIIHFTYRKVSDFSLLTPVQQCILRMNQGNTAEQRGGGGGYYDSIFGEEHGGDSDSDMDDDADDLEDRKSNDDGDDDGVKKDKKEQIPVSREEEIIAEIAKQFHLSKQKAREAYEANKSASKIAYIRRETGTDIFVDYVQPVESGSNFTYSFVVHNSHSINEVHMIRKLLLHVLNVYIAYSYPRVSLGSPVEFAIEPIKNRWKVPVSMARREKPTAEKELEAGIIEMVEERAGAFLGNAVEDIGKHIEQRPEDYDEVDLEALLMENDAFGANDGSPDSSLETMIDQELEELNESDKKLIEEEEQVEQRQREVRFGDAVEQEDIGEQVAKEAVKQMKMGLKKTTTVSVILNRLYEMDKQLFNLVKEDEVADAKKQKQKAQSKNYATTCQSIDRQPKVLTDEEFKKQDPASFSVTMHKKNKDGTITEVVPRVCDMNDPEFRKLISSKGSESKVLCSAIKWGSSKENQNWYICPRIFDTKKQTALTPGELEYQEGRFEPMRLDDAKTDDEKVNAWRTDAKGRDILEFKPRTKDTHYEPLTTDNSESARPIDALFIQNSKKSMKSYVYPGFMDAKNHWQNMYFPCCYESASSRVNEAFTQTAHVTQKQAEYFLQWGKPLEPGRYGYVSDDLMKLLGLDNPCKKKTKYDCIMRLNMRNDNYSFIRLMARVSNMYPIGNVSVEEDRKALDLFLSKVCANITEERFMRFNRGQMHHEFRLDAITSELQNYIEYLIADTPHKLSHLYDLFTTPGILDTELQPGLENGLRILVVETMFNPNKKEYTYRMVVPYYRTPQPDALKKKQHCIVVLKQYDKEFYELLEFNMNPFVDSWIGTSDKGVRHHLTQMDMLIERSLESLSQTNVPMSKEWMRMLKDARTKSTIFTMKDARSALTALGDGITKCVYDGNKIIGIYSVELRVMVPVYPIDLTMDVKVCPTDERISLDELYSGASTLLVDYNEYWGIVGEVCKKTKAEKRIDVRYIYRAPESRDSQMRVTGFMSQYGVYVPVKPTLFKSLSDEIQRDVPWKTDAFIVNRQIRKTVDDTLKYRIYNTQNSVDTIKQYVDGKLMTIKKVYINKNTVNKRQHVLGIETDKGIYIPFDADEVVYYNDNEWLHKYSAVESTDGRWTTKKTINEYMEIVQKYYQELNDRVAESSYADVGSPTSKKASLYFRPMRLYMEMDETAVMKVSGLILQTGTVIHLESKNHIELNGTSGMPVHQMREFYQRPLIHRLLMDKWVVIQSSNLWLGEDRRILSNTQFQYHQTLYNNMIQHLNRFLKKPEQMQLREWIISFLDDRSISEERKLRLIRPLYVSIMQSCVRLGKDDVTTKPTKMGQYKVYIWNIYFNTWGMDVTEEDIWTNQFRLKKDDYERMSKKERIEEFYRLYAMHFESYVADDVRIINDVLALYKPWYEQWIMREKKDRTHECITVDTTLVRSEEVLEKLYYELVKNRVSRDMILQEYSASAVSGRYQHHPTEELLITERDKWVAHIVDLYKTMSRVYYRQFRTLNDLEYEMTIEINESERLRHKNLYSRES